MNTKSLFSLCLVTIAMTVGVISAQGLGTHAHANPIQDGSDSKAMPTAGASTTPPQEMKLETATFGAGCFWCVEAVFQKLKGVEAVESGYMGGHTPNPTYKQICTGDTGHAEIIPVSYTHLTLPTKRIV